MSSDPGRSRRPTTSSTSARRPDGDDARDWAAAPDIGTHHRSADLDGRPRRAKAVPIGQVVVPLALVAAVIVPMPGRVLLLVVAVVAGVAVLARRASDTGTIAWAEVEAQGCRHFRAAGYGEDAARRWSVPFVVAVHARSPGRRARISDVALVEAADRWLDRSPAERQGIDAAQLRAALDHGVLDHIDPVERARLLVEAEQQPAPQDATVLPFPVPDAAATGRDEWAAVWRRAEDRARRLHDLDDDRAGEIAMAITWELQQASDDLQVAPGWEALVDLLVDGRAEDASPEG